MGKWTGTVDIIDDIAPHASSNHQHVRNPKFPLLALKQVRDNIRRREVPLCFIVLTGTATQFRVKIHCRSRKESTISSFPQP